MAILTASVLRRLERQHAQGISSAAVVEAFSASRARFSEATLRKYVQLGLLPKSRRVGTRGRHRGSSGLYPVGVVRLINEIKRRLDRGATLDEIRLGCVGVSGDLQSLQRLLDQLFGRLAEATARRADPRRRRRLKGLVGERRRAMVREVRALERLAGRLD